MSFLKIYDPWSWEVLVFMYSQNVKLVKDDLFIVEAEVMGEEKR